MQPSAMKNRMASRYVDTRAVMAIIPKLEALGLSLYRSLNRKGHMRFLANRYS
jgi:hypothetical protein